MTYYSADCLKWNSIVHSWLIDNIKNLNDRKASQSSHCLEIQPSRVLNNCRLLFSELASILNFGDKNDNYQSG